MTRWLVISNCQTRGLAQSLALRAPQLEVEWCEHPTYRKERDHWKARLPDYAKIVIISQIYDADLKLDTSGLDTIVLPPIFFPGYHPDEAVLVVDRMPINGCLGLWHSLIAFSGFRRGLNVAETAALYRKETYDALDYLGWWSQWRTFLLNEFADCGFDISAEFNRWSRGRAFMYNGNHPRVECLFDVAGLILENNGHVPQRPNCLPNDYLALDACFPVYPEIAAGLGFEGSYLFKPSDPSNRCFDLETFIRRQFAIYETYGAEQITVEKGRRHVLETLESL
jgi:Polysaccharide biosynthesis enzyme WcbI